MLFGRVTDFGVRTNLHTQAALSKTQNPFRLHGFEELDRLVYADFLGSLPPMYKDYLGNPIGLYGGGLDTDLYLVHLAPHA